MIIQAIRSILFYALLFVITTVLVLVCIPFTPFPRAQLTVTRNLANSWAAIMKWLLRWLVGIRTLVEGIGNVPEGGALIVSKHQSDWDVIALYPLLGHPAFIAKKELFNIPVFGRALRTLDIIEIDRKKGAAAVPGMIRQAQTEVNKGRKILIFPEGTRKPPFGPPNYRSGAARLYEALGAPLVPVALNSGLTWGRNSLILWPGTATARFLPPIKPGLGQDEVQARYSELVERESLKLGLEEVDKGVARPLDAELRDRIEAARRRLSGA